MRFRKGRFVVIVVVSPIPIIISIISIPIISYLIKGFLNLLFLFCNLGYFLDRGNNIAIVLKIYNLGENINIIGNKIFGD
jgi:hypothetical protein